MNSTNHRLRYVSFLSRCSVALALVLVLVTIFVKPAFSASVSAGLVRGYPGTSVPMPVAMDRASNVVAVQFELSFDSKKITPDATMSLTNFRNYTVRSREIAPGVVRTILYSLSRDTLRTNGRIDAVSFRVSPDERVGSGPVTPQRALLVTENNGTIGSVTTAAGRIIISQINPPDVDGVAAVFFPSEPDKSYVLFASENLASWFPIGTNLATQSFVDFLDVEAAQFPYRFYKMVSFESLTKGHLSISRDGGDTLRISIHGFTGHSYSLEVSSDLNDWELMGNRIAVNNRAEFTDQFLPGSRNRFYRVVSVPVPP